MERLVVVVNQFALPRGESGGTRHVDLYGELPGWSAKIVAGDINHSSGERFLTDDRRFALVGVPSYRGNGIARVLGWFVFTFRALFVAVRSAGDVYIGSTPHPLAPLAALVAAKLKRKRFVLEVRDLWPESIVAAGIASERNVLVVLLKFYERFLYRQADLIIGVTPGWAQYFVERGVERAKFRVVTNGTALSAFPSALSPEGLIARRKAAGIVGPSVVFAGSHGPKDGIGKIVDAAAALPEVSFYLYGGGSDKERQVAEAERRQLSNIYFRRGVSKEQLPELLQLFDAGLHVVAPLTVFDRGMSPNKLFDYLAAGIPVVSNALVPLRAVVLDGQVGAVTEPDGLASGISRVLNASGAEKAEWMAEGRRLVLEEYSRDRQKAVIVEMLEGLTL